MEIKCPKCGEALELPDEAVGARVQCPFCEGTFVGEKPVLLRLRPASRPSTSSQFPFTQQHVLGGEESRCDSSKSAQLVQPIRSYPCYAVNEEQWSDRIESPFEVSETALVEVLKKFVGRKLTLLQKDRVESFKRIIKEAKSEKDLLLVYKKIGRFIKEERLDWIIDGDPSWNALAIEDDFGKDTEPVGMNTKAKADYEGEKEALFNRLLVDDSFSRDDYTRAVHVAIEKSRKAGYDPCPVHEPADYARGLDEGVYAKLLGGESRSIRELKAELAYRESGARQASDGPAAQDFHVLGEELRDPAIAKAFTNAAVPVIVGRSGSTNYFEDMRDRALNIMVVGDNGSGKTTFGRTVLAGWLMKDPYLVTPFVIDPNGVYEDICRGTPRIGYAGGERKILPALEFLNNELERRIKILHGWIDQYNSNPPCKPMSMMPVLFDDVDDALAADPCGRIRNELDALGRSGAKCGLNIVVMSRRASVLPYGLSINIGARIVFRVAEDRDSEAAIGDKHPEAAMALGRGDGYYCPGRGGGPIRIQTPILNDDSFEGQTPDVRKIIIKRKVSTRIVIG